MVIMVEMGIVVLLLVRVKKRKARRAKLFQQRKKWGKKINQIIQTMSQQGKEPIIIITMVR